MSEIEKIIESVALSFKRELEDEMKQSPMRYNETSVNILRGGIAACDSLQSVNSVDLEKLIDVKIELINHVKQTLLAIGELDEVVFPLLDGYLDGYGSVKGQIFFKK